MEAVIEKIILSFSNFELFVVMAVWAFLNGVWSDRCDVARVKGSPVILCDMWGIVSQVLWFAVMLLIVYVKS